MSELNIRLGSEGLLLSRNQSFSFPTFFLDLNQSGCIGIRGDPENVLRVVNIARDIADSEGYGEHNAILNLVVHKRELTDQCLRVFWIRHCHRFNGDMENLISLGEWLREKGFPYAPRE